MPHCSNCGNEMLDANVCPSCGHRAPESTITRTPASNRTTASLPLGEYLKTGWRLFLNFPGGFVGFFLVYLLIQIVLSFVPWIGGVASFVVGPALMMGNFIVCAKLLQSRSPQFSDFFLGFRFFIPLLLTALVGGVLVGIGFLLLVIPGIYLLVSYLFASSLVVDRRLDFWPALELSRRTIQPMWFGFFAFFLLLILINLAGAVALGVGLLVTVPFTCCVVTVAYADIFGLQSDYSEGFPDNVPVEAASPLKDDRQST